MNNNGYKIGRKTNDEVWYQQHGGLGKCSGLLVYDSIEAYVTDNVTVLFTQENTSLALILSILTSVL